MTFRVPSVIVYQEFLTATPTVTTPFFDLCIVGPCYQVVEETACTKFVATDSVYRHVYPGLMAGSKLDTKFTNVKLSDIYVKIWPESNTASSISSGVNVDNSGYDKTAEAYTTNISAYNTATEAYVGAYPAYEEKLTAYNDALAAYNDALAAYEAEEDEDTKATLEEEKDAAKEALDTAKEELATAKDVLAVYSAALQDKTNAIHVAYDGFTRVTGKNIDFSTENIEEGDILDVTYAIGNKNNPDRYVEKTMSAKVKSISKDSNTLILSKSIYDTDDAYEELFSDLDYLWDEAPTEAEKAAISITGSIRRYTKASLNIVAEEGSLKPWVTWYENIYTGEIKEELTDAILNSPIELAKWSQKDGFTLEEGLTIATEATYGDEAYICQATTKVTFRALRTDVANDFNTISTYAQAKAVFGELNYNNPISVACYLVSQAMSDMRFKVLPIIEDTDTGYIAALDILSNNEDVYVIVPLSQSKNVISAYANHCTSMSVPEKSMWRICYGSSVLPPTKVILELNNAKMIPGAAGFMYIKDEDGGFVSRNVRTGDYVDLYEEDGDEISRTFSYKIESVVNDSVVKCYTDKYLLTGTSYVDQEESLGIEEFGPTGKGKKVTYEVVRVLDQQGQADAISEIAQSYDNKRLRLVYPDEVLIDLNGTTYMTPSYYLCVTLGAMRAGYAPHQGFSTMGLSGISRIYHSNKYFTDDQLADMAGNGAYWVCQDAIESLPYVLYQTTTCTDSLEVAEDSCVATVDYASKFYKSNLKAALGKYNVNTISIKYVTNIINACSDRMVTTKYEYIGSLLTSANLISIVGEKDKIKPTIKIEIPYPVNGIDVTLQV